MSSLAIDNSMRLVHAIREEAQTYKKRRNKEIREYIELIVEFRLVLRRGRRIIDDILFNKEARNRDESRDLLRRVAGDNGVIEQTRDLLEAIQDALDYLRPEGLDPIRKLLFDLVLAKRADETIEKHIDLIGVLESFTDDGGELKTTDEMIALLDADG